MLVFMGGFGVWTQVWSKGSCVGKREVGSSNLLVSSRHRKTLYLSAFQPYLRVLFFANFLKF